MKDLNHRAYIRSADAGAALAPAAFAAPGAVSPATGAAGSLALWAFASSAAALA